MFVCRLSFNLKLENFWLAEAKKYNEVVQGYFNRSSKFHMEK